MLTYLVEELGKCSVIWQEQLKEICVVKGEYIGNGLVKGREDLSANYLINIYGEQLYTFRRSWLRNEVIPVYVRGKLFTNENEFCIKDTVGTYVTLGKDALIMPKSAWKEVDLSLTTIEKFHDIMDATSLVPVLGVGADIANATVYAMEKEYAQMWIYLGFATVSVVTAGFVSSGKFSKNVGIKLTKKRGVKKLPKSAKKMTLKEYEKKYGKAYVEVTSYEKVKIISKETKMAEKLTIEDLKKPLTNRGVTDYKLKILEEKGVKFTRKNVLEVFTKTESGMIFWLEKGNKNAGWEHMLKHFEQIKNQIKLTKAEEIIDIIGNLLKREPICEFILESGPTNVYKIAEDKFFILAYGHNGFIVTLYYSNSKKEILRKLNQAIKIIRNGL